MPLEKHTIWNISWREYGFNKGQITISVNDNMEYYMESLIEEWSDLIG